jgi:hypothetical protein
VFQIDKFENSGSDFLPFARVGKATVDSKRVSGRRFSMLWSLIVEFEQIEVSFDVPAPIQTRSDRGNAPQRLRGFPRPIHSGHGWTLLPARPGRD